MLHLGPKSQVSATDQGRQREKSCGAEGNSLTNASAPTMPSLTVAFPHFHQTKMTTIKQLQREDRKKGKELQLLNRLKRKHENIINRKNMECKMVRFCAWYIQVWDRL